MGIYDRDYLRDDRGPAIADVGRTACGNLIVITVAVWIGQLIMRRPPNLLGADPTIEFLGLSWNDLFGPGFPKLWGLVTAIFAHDVWRITHILFNMLFLYAFGRQVEMRYGKAELVVFYLIAGGLAAFAEVISLGRFGQEHVPVVGASGAVMGLMAVYVLLGPREPVNLLIFSVPRWAIAVFFMLGDLRGVASASGNGVANLAHIVGAAYGFAFFTLDLRIVGRMQKARARPPARVPRSRPAPPAPAESAETLAVRARVDELLAKISAVGQEGLEDEELRFLKDHAHLFRKS